MQKNLYTPGTFTVNEPLEVTLHAEMSELQDPVVVTWHALAVNHATGGVSRKRIHMLSGWFLLPTSY